MCRKPVRSQAILILFVIAGMFVVQAPLAHASSGLTSLEPPAGQRRGGDRRRPPPPPPPDWEFFLGHKTGKRHPPPPPPPPPPPDWHHQLNAARSLATSGNHAAAISIYTWLANQGIADAQVELANCYYNAKGVGYDWDLAFRLNSMAAQSGHPRAMANVGLAYQEGRGAKLDFMEAGRWFERAAAAGDAEGQYELGRYYYLGMMPNYPRDFARARHLLTLSANQGHRMATTTLKTMDEMGW